MDNGKIVTPEDQQDELIAALSIGGLLAGRNDHPDTARILFALRDSVRNNYKPVWTNGKAIRRYQGQDKSHEYLKDNGWRKEIGIFINEKI